MKLPLVSSALLSFLLLLAQVASGQSTETLTLQVDLSRWENTFKLRQIDFYGAEHERAVSVSSLDDTGQFPYANLQSSIDPAGGPWRLVDETRNEIAPQNLAALRDAQWDAIPDPNATTITIFFALPTSRAGHVFSIMEPNGNGFSPVTSGPVLTWINPDGTQQSLSVFQAWAPLWTPDIPFVLFDHHTGEASWASERDLQEPSKWEPYSGYTPTGSLQILLPASEAGKNYTLRSDAGSAVSLAGVVAQHPNDPYQTVALLSSEMGFGREYWLSRDADDAVSADPRPRMILSGQTTDWASTSAFPTLPPADWVQFTLRVNGVTRGDHQLAIRYSDGEIQPLSVSWWDTIYSWDDYGNENSLLVMWHYPSYDRSRGWEIIDQTTGETLQSFSRNTTWDNIEHLDGWTAGNHSSPPSGALTVYLPATRRGHTLWLETVYSGRWAVSETGESWWTGSYGPWGDWVEAEVIVATVPHDSSGFDGAALFDETTNESVSVGSDSVWDHSTWHPAPTALVLQLSESRWTHHLRLRQPDGSEFALTKGSLQGTWTVDPQGRSWFTSYEVFDGSTRAYGHLEWWVYDATTDEVSPRNAQNLTTWYDPTDTDQDGLADWQEYRLGTSATNPDTDGDTYSDGNEVASGWNPRISTNSPTTSNSTLVVFTPLQ